MDVQNDNYVTVRDRGSAREISFSPSEKEGNKYQHDGEQMIDALQDMDIAGSSSMVNSEHMSRMQCDVDGDDLFGEEINEMENQEVAWLSRIQQRLKNTNGTLLGVVEHELGQELVHG